VFTFCPPKLLPELETESVNGQRFYVLPDGSKLPSVTTVLGAQSKEGILKWRKRVGEEEARRVSAKASGRGTRMHSLCEDYLNNDPLRATMPDAMEMFLSIKPLLNRIDNIHYQECALWSKKLGMAGRVDCIGEFDGELAVIDFKTSGKIKQEDYIKSYFWQTTAYSLMYEEMVGNPIENIVIIMAVENNPPQLFVKKRRDYIKGLADAIIFYKNSLVTK
jgi:genome maintenance exonuclease 1